jgi:hypothetical protein
MNTFQTFLAELAEIPWLGFFVAITICAVPTFFGYLLGFYMGSKWEQSECDRRKARMALRLTRAMVMDREFVEQQGQD